MEMQVKYQRVAKIELVLNEIEIRALKALVQNPITQDEDAVTSYIRKIIFEALSQ